MYENSQVQVQVPYMQKMSLQPQLGVATDSIIKRTMSFDRFWKDIVLEFRPLLEEIEGERCAVM